MLGKLATWLRLVGCDVEYCRTISDDELVEQASRTGRIILTRDTELVRRRQVRGNHFFVRGDNYRGQLRQVAEHFSIAPSGRIMTQCLRCNTILQGIDPSEVREQVPPYVFNSQQEFKTCGHCGRIYWKGTHRDKVLAELQDIFKQNG